MEKKVLRTTVATVAVATMLVVGSPNSVGNQESHHKSYTNNGVSKDKVRALFEMVRERLYKEAESSFHDEGWDIKKLLRTQTVYKSVQSDFSKYGLFKSMIPENVMTIVPQIKEASTQHGVNPYLVAGIILNESNGYPYAIKFNYNKRQKHHNEVSMGLMQVNLLAHPITLSQYRCIFDIKTNLDIGCGILKQCVDNTANLDLAVRAYNGGIPNFRHKGRWFAETNNYVQKVKMYTKLVRRSKLFD